MSDYPRRTRLQRSLHALSRKDLWRSWRWRGGLTALVIAMALLVRFVSEIGYERTPESRFLITKVIDGDTVELSGGERLRLLFIDTPERGEPYYDSAKALVQALALGKYAELHFGKRKRDGYGRLLATLLIDSIDVNRELLRRGFANLYLFKDNLKDPATEREMKTLLQTQKNALAEKRGLWSINRTEEERYVTTRRSLRFHRPTCRLIHDHPQSTLRTFQSREEALSEGLSPCRTCRP